TEFKTEERALLDYLFSVAKYPEFQMRLKWRPDTVAFWDNRSTQHYAIQDYHPQVRTMHRATIIGSEPIPAL
ncbi:MAG: TauD/TfdA dioxygenase family protein, partial [Lautropia sp.]